MAIQPCLPFLFLLHYSFAISEDHLPLSTSHGPELFCPGSTFACSDNFIILPRNITLITSTSKDLTCNEKMEVVGKKDADSIKCQKDITMEMEKRCFGSLDCSLEGDWLDSLVRNCSVHNGFVFYNISYDCLPYEYSPCFDCKHSSKKAKIRSSQGYLSSAVAAIERNLDHCGSSRCPWVIQTPPGQTVNITFIQAKTLTAERPQSSDNSCTSVVFSVSESAIPKGSKTCSGGQRLSHVHTSVSNVVSMYYNEEQLSNIGKRYLVYYEVTGCADIIPPKFSRMHRSHNTVSIECDQDEDLHWRMDCVEGKWVGLDEVGECPPSLGYMDAQKEAVRAEEKGTLFDTTLFNMPVGVMMTLVVASAVVLGILVLTMGMVCLKRHNYDLKHKDDPNIYGAACSEFEFKEMGGGLMTAQKFAHQQHLLAQADRQRRASGDLLARDNTYAMQELVRMDTRPLPSLPNNNSPSATFNRQGPVPYGVYPQARVAVQFHRADSDVMASGYPGHQFLANQFPGNQFPGNQFPGNQFPGNQFPGNQFPGPPRGYMTSRPGMQPRHPCDPRMPHQATMGRPDDNHLYFVLDGNAPDEKIGTLPPPPDNLLPPANPPPPTTMPPPAHNRATPNTGAAM